MFISSFACRRRVLPLIAAAAVTILPAVASAQAQPAQIHDTSALKPPAGARVAIVEFDDLECPACRVANPTLKSAAATYKIPWVRHDFLIPSHPWSRNAAIMARWFDTQGKELGDAYRDAVFEEQEHILNLNMLNQFTLDFAQKHGVRDFPMMALDPQGTLTAKVQTDSDLALRMGLTVTPSIFVVMAGSKGTPYIQIMNVQRDLYAAIDQAMKETGGR